MTTLYQSSRFTEPKTGAPEEKEERRYQERLLGVKLKNQKFYCSQKAADAFKTFFHGRDQIGKIGTDADGKPFVQIFSLDLDMKSTLASKCSDEEFHAFLEDCYCRICEIHEKRLQASAKAVQDNENLIKFHEKATKTFEKNLSEMWADQRLARQQKAAKPQPAVFNKDDLKTWQGLSSEDAETSKSRLVEKKTGCLNEIDNRKKEIQGFTSESEAFQKKVTALEVKLSAATDEKQYKEVRLSFDFNQLQIEKIQKKSEKTESEKSDIETELTGLDKQIQVLNCVLDRQKLESEAKNWRERKARVAERFRRILKDRDDLNNTRENLNKLWLELTADPEFCKPLCLKASGQHYFL